MSQRKSDPVSWSERIATAWVSLIAAAVTALFVIGAVFFAGSMDFSWSEVRQFFLWGAIFSIGAGILGFFAGSERMAEYFGWLWGTSEPSGTESAVAVTVLIVFLAAVIYVSFIR
jgi:hypothetical protein